MSTPKDFRFLRRAFALIAFGSVVLMAGCGQDNTPKRGHLHGKVTVDGVPLAKGQIRIFALTAGGVGTDAEIVNGKYDIPVERGPSAGTYRIEIESLKATGKKVLDPDTRQMVDEVANELPARYHVESTLKIDYDPSSDKPYDFELKKK